MDSHKHEKGKCCPEGSWPALKVDYKPKGKKFTLKDFQVYHVGESDKVLIIISDIFGAFSGRHQSVADTFAEFGYSVYLPQILINPYSEGHGNMMDVIKGQDWEKMQERFKTLHHYLAEKGHKQFYAAGFCWGVWAGFKFATKFEGFRAFMGYHPSLVLCGFFGEDQVKLIQSIKCPAYMCPAQNDPANIKEGGQLFEILKKRFGNEKVGTHQFKQEQHGWVVRGDITQPTVHRDVQLALKLGKEYFAKL